MLRTVPPILMAVTALAFANAVAAQIPEGMEGSFQPHPEAEEAIGRLYSPFCPGFMLEVCTSAQASALRDSIQFFAYQGWTSDELVEWMVGNYGERYRAVPQARGFGLWAWIFPPIGLLLGAAMVFVALRRFRPVEAPESDSRTEAAKAPITSEDEERLKAAIRDIELREDPTF